MSEGIIDLVSALLGGLAASEKKDFSFTFEQSDLFVFSIGGNMTQTKFDNTTLRICQGDTTAFKLTEANAFDFSGYTIKSTGKYDLESTEKAFEVTVSDSVNGSNFAEGIIVVVLTDEQTATIKRSGFWDIQAKKDGKVYTLLRGDFQLLPDISPEA